MSEDSFQPNSVSEQLERFAGTLHNHLKMLGELIPWMKWFDTNGPVILRNACLESYLTHARLLIEFIAGRPNEKNWTKRRHNSRDLQPETFGLSEWAINVPNYFDVYLDLMDKHLSHLSLERVTSSDARTWAVDRIANPLLAEYGNFADRLRGEGNSRCADTISSGVSEAVSLMNRSVHV
jgi:hypothetical protein